MMMMTSRFFLPWFAIFAADAALTTRPTRSGLVRGFISNDTLSGNPVEVYRGIPFAAPPTGEKRWRAPQLEEKWSGARDARAFGHACVQKPNAFTEIYPVTTSEDCLYLNVYRPSSLNESASVPIIVFFHGGSYVLGSGSFLLYDGSNLAAMREDVIVVTANYRLSAFGFLGGAKLRDGGAGNSTGNWGLLDQRAVLQWVRDNLSAWGGDVDRVTIQGESAGAGSVSCHMTSPLSWPLFHRAIMESGPIAAQWIALAASDAETSFRTVAANLRCDDVDCMRSKSAEDVLDASRSGIIDHDMIDWAPVVDGVVLAEEPRVLLAAGRFHRVPVLLGTNKNEGTEFTSPSDMSPEQFNALMQKRFGPKLASQVAAEYPLADFSSPFAAAAAVEGDFSMTCPARETAAYLSDFNVTAYLYFFTHQLEIARAVKSNLGVFHGEELPFVFNMLTAFMGPKERILAKQFAMWFTAFAADGKMDAPWEPYSRSADALLNISLTQKMESGVKKSKCDWWKAHA